MIDKLLRLQIKAAISIDDIRINNIGKEEIEQDAVITKAVFEKAGWTFNKDKETPPDLLSWFLLQFLDAKV